MATGVSFDHHAHTYEQDIARAIGSSGRRHAFFLDAKAEVIAELCRQRLGVGPLAAGLDVGCGIGLLAGRLAGLFTSFHGVDPSEPAIELARRNVPGVHLQAYDGELLPFAEATFDVALATLVFHHVPPPQWPSLLTEMRRVVRPGGLVVLVEHNPWNPLSRLVVNRCAFDRDAVLLAPPVTHRLFSEAGLAAPETRFFLFFPWQLPADGHAARLLAKVPLGAQYVVSGVRP